MNNKGIAVLLATIMAVSMVAMGFVGGAAAMDTDQTDMVDTSENVNETFNVANGDVNVTFESSVINSVDAEENGTVGIDTDDGLDDDAQHWAGVTVSAERVNELGIIDQDPSDVNNFLGALTNDGLDIGADGSGGLDSAETYPAIFIDVDPDEHNGDDDFGADDELIAVVYTDDTTDTSDPDWEIYTVDDDGVATDQQTSGDNLDSTIDDVLDADGHFDYDLQDGDVNEMWFAAGVGMGDAADGFTQGEASDDANFLSDSFTVNAMSVENEFVLHSKVIVADDPDDVDLPGDDALAQDIGTGINDAGAGDAVIVANGTYDEEPTVDQDDLQLLGAQSDVDPTTAGDRAASIDESTIEGMVTVDEPDVEVDGFEVDAVAGSPGDSAIVVNDNVDIENNIVSPESEEDGIEADTEGKDVDIESNEIDQVDDAAGISVDDDDGSADYTIDGNNVTGDGIDAADDVGLELDNWDNDNDLTLEANDLEDLETMVSGLSDADDGPEAVHTENEFSHAVLEFEEEERSTLADDDAIYGSIAKAEDEATAGNVLDVREDDATYGQDVEISKELTVLGSEAGEDATEARDDTAEIDGQLTTDTDDGIKVDGLELTNDGDVVVIDNDDVKIHNNTVDVEGDNVAINIDSNTPEDIEVNDTHIAGDNDISQGTGLVVDDLNSQEDLKLENLLFSGNEEQFDGTDEITGAEDIEAILDEHEFNTAVRVYDSDSEDTISEDVIYGSIDAADDVITTDGFANISAGEYDETVTVDTDTGATFAGPQEGVDPTEVDRTDPDEEALVKDTFTVDDQEGIIVDGLAFEVDSGTAVVLDDDDGEFVNNIVTNEIGGAADIGIQVTELDSAGNQQIDSNWIDGFDTYGLHIDSASAGNELTVNHNTITESDDGINVDQTDGEYINIEQNEITENDDGIQVVDSDVDPSDLVISNNSITENEDNAIELSGSDDLDARYNYLGESDGIVGPNAVQNNNVTENNNGDVFYEPLLTVEHTEIEESNVEDTVDYAFDLTVEDGGQGEFAPVGFSGQSDQELGEAFSDFEGVIYEWDAEEERFDSLDSDDADREVDTLEAFIASPADGEDVIVNIEIEDDVAITSPASTELETGWNFVASGSERNADEDQALNVESGDGKQLFSYSEQPGAIAGAGSGYVTGTQTTEGSGELTSPFVGYFVFVDDDTALASQVTENTNAGDVQDDFELVQP